MLLKLCLAWTPGEAWPIDIPIKTKLTVLIVSSVHCGFLFQTTIPISLSPSLFLSFSFAISHTFFLSPFGVKTVRSFSFFLMEIYIWSSARHLQCTEAVGCLGSKGIYWEIWGKILSLWLHFHLRNEMDPLVCWCSLLEMVTMLLF